MVSSGKIVLCVVLCFLACMGTVQAGTVYNNFGPGSGGFEYNPGISWLIAGHFTGFNYVEQAHSFTPAESGPLSDIYLALEKVLQLNECTVRLALDNGALPSEDDILETWILYDLPFGGSGHVEQLVSVEQPCLTAGQSYWIWISADEGSSVAWGENVTGAIGHMAQRLYEVYVGYFWNDLGDQTISAMRVDVIDTVSASISCTPSSGTLPFGSLLSVLLENLYDGERRRMAAHLDVNLANGQSYPNWRTGNTIIQAGDSSFVTWTQNLPAIPSLIGVNTFTLVAEDVTPAPFNQPPHPASGDTDTATCTVEGIAP